MAMLVPCESCNRHVRAREACPFCGARAVDSNVSSITRSSRAALFAIATATAACTQQPQPQVTMYGGPPVQAEDGATPAATTSAAPTTTASATPATSNSQTAHVTAYGGPPTASATPQIAPKH